jgi:very-short-patch-repair endonuclease
MPRADAGSFGIPKEPGSAPMEIAAVAARQRGLMTRAQLVTAGLSDATIHDWARRGHLHRVHRGVFAVGHPRSDMETAWLAGALAAGPDAAISHRSSGELQRFLAVDQLHWHRSPVHLTRPGGSARRAGLIIHSGRLESIDVIEVRGIPATSAARTLYDLPPTLDERGLRSAFDEAEYLGVLDRGRLAFLCEGGKGHRNVAALRRLLGQAPLPLAAVRSRLEALLLRICRDQSLPLPAVNVPLLSYEVDFLWARERFVVEVDGSQHRDRRRDRDNRRDLRLGRAGYLVRRYSSTDLRRPDAVAHEVRSILAERSGQT